MNKIAMIYYRGEYLLIDITDPDKPYLVTSMTKYDYALECKEKLEKGEEI